jgi:signal peptidase
VRWIARLLTLCFAIAVAGGVMVTVVLPRAVHGQAMTVLSGSMTPTIPVGAIVVVRPVDPGTLRVGDIATYQKRPGEDIYVTHRIVAIDRNTNPATFTFKGDANPTPDLDPVVSGQIRGQVWFDVPYLGAVRDALHGKGGVTLLFMLVLAGYAISQTTSGLREQHTNPSSFSIERPIVLAVLDKPTLAAATGRSATQAALVWSGLLMQEDGHSATVLLAPPVGGLDACLEEINSSRPTQLLVLSGGEVSGSVLADAHVPADPDGAVKESDDVLA